tara:strand:+ start:12241 stop:15561 length:3321 start_codon:yes stop_codon:yes gene_type:complete
MTSESQSTNTSTPLVRGLIFVSAWVAVISALYHIAAVYLSPLPGEMHPNMHMLLAYIILLVGGAGAMPDVYGEKIKKLNILPIFYVASLFPAVFFFYFAEELGEGWSEQNLLWLYALPFIIWAAMIVIEKSWYALTLWFLGFVPFFLLLPNWSSLSESTQEPTLWWFLLASAIPTMWTLFGVFYRPLSGIKNAGVSIIVFFTSLFLICWRVFLWANQTDAIRSFTYLWPLLILMLPLIWARRKMREKFEETPSYPYPAGLTIGLNSGMLLYVVVACLYLFYFHEEMVDRVSAPTVADTRVGFIMMVVALELTRRSFGPPLPILAIISISYGIWGNLFASPFGHGGHTWVEMLAKLTTDFIGGILGFLVVISATFIIMFLILGAFLHESGAGKFFVNLALGLFGKMRAGAGLAAVGSSALMGTVSGSASGNVVTTGTFTIPLMKRIGLSPHIAGAAEAAASSGGQIMPPVMGAGAFIMAELIEVPYFQIILYATIPAILYFVIVGINIHFASGALNMKPLAKSEIPDWKMELRSGWFYLVPLAFLVYFLFEGRTPVFAGVMSVFIMVGVWFYRNTGEFLASFRKDDSVIPNDVYVFVPVTFWVFSFIIFSLLNTLEVWFGWSLGIRDTVQTMSIIKAVVFIGITGTVITSLLIRTNAAGKVFWNEIQMAWPVIYPVAALGLWMAFGWTSGVAGAFVVLLLLSLLSIVRGNLFNTTTIIPWLFVLIWGGTFVFQKGLYYVLPALSDFSEWFIPFGFIYHSIIFFGIGAIIQKIILSSAQQSNNTDNKKPNIKQVVAIFLNPFIYSKNAKKLNVSGPDVQASDTAGVWIVRIREALKVGGKQGAEFGVTLATIDIVVTVLTITGIGNKFAFLIEALANDICFFGTAVGGGCAYYLGLDGFFVGLLLTAICCAVLGMGMPTTAAYVLLAILGGPVLIKLVGPELTSVYGAEWAKEFIANKGDRVASHMFIFYFAILSAITPPVAIASLVGAKLAGATYFKTSIMSLRFAIVGFVVPFLFMYEPALLTFGTPGRILLSSVMTLIAFIAFSAATQGWLLERLRYYERVLLSVAFVVLILFIIFHSFVMLTLGMIAIGIPLFRQISERKKQTE